LQLILVSLAAFAAQFAFGQGGTVTGTVRLTGTPPANPVIRMGADPNCLNFNAGKRVFMPNVEAGAGGALASVFVHVQGSFPGAPGGSGSVTLDQKGCMYHPVISGAQVGQTLVIRNDDSTLHNIHSLSKIYTFDQSQPRAGMTFEVPLKTEEVMLHVKCNVHPWMSGYIGIASNPYYAVTDETGKFTIKNVPAGKQTIQVWQDAYGPLTQTVDVKAGATVNVDFAYTGNEHPTASQMGPIQEITIPAEVTVASIVLTGR
jgi:plastocyanin